MRAVIAGVVALGAAYFIPDRAGAVTLEEALITAYNNSPILLARRAELRATDERMAQAVSGWRPTLTGDASYIERHQDAGIGGANSPINPDVQFNPFRVGVVAEQPIYRGGRTMPEMRQAKAEIRQSRANLQITEQDVLLNTSVTFFDVRQDQTVLDLNQNNVEVLRQQLAATEDRFAVGEITRTDVAQAEAALSSAIARLTLARARLTANRARYQRYVGMLPANLEAPAGLPPLPANESDALAIAVERNPNLIAARYSEDAARHFVRRAVGDLLPRVSVEGEFSRTKEPSQFRDYSRTRQVMARLTIPLYQAGAASSRVREARQIHSQRRIETHETDRALRDRLKETWANFISVQSTIDSRREQVRANEVALEGVRQEALVGSRTTLDVLDEDQRLLDSRVELENAIRDEFAAAFQILSLTGELVPEKLGLAVTHYDPKEHYKEVRYQLFGIGRSAEADPLPNVDDTSVTVPLSDDDGPDPSDESAAPDTSGLNDLASEGQESDRAAQKDEEPQRQTGELLVQMAAYRSVARADRGWEILAARHKKALANYRPDLVGVDLGDKGVYYRLRAGPIADRHEADQLCGALKDEGQNCLIVTH